MSHSAFIFPELNPGNMSPFRWQLDGTKVDKVCLIVGPLPSADRQDFQILQGDRTDGAISIPPVHGACHPRREQIARTQWQQKVDGHETV